MLDFVLPPLCLGCTRYWPDHEPLCQACRDAIEPIQTVVCLNCSQSLGQTLVCHECGPESLPLLAWGKYAAPMDEIIKQFKFHGMTSVAVLLARHHLAAFEWFWSQQTTPALVAIPLHPLRENWRGYNQSEKIARAISSLTGVSVIKTDAIRRVRLRRPQSRLAFSKRETNIRGAFRSEADLSELPPLILVDDVVTSGGTVREAARTIKQAGGAVRAVVAIAYGGQ